MKEIILKHKKIIIAILVFLLLIVIFWDNLPISNSTTNAEETAQKFVEHMLDGNAEKCTSLMCDDLISVAGYETKKLFINAFEKQLDSMIDAYKDKYGRSWSYNVVVIDSFNVDVYDAIDYIQEYAEAGTVVKVVLEIEHKGGGLFKDKEGTDEVSLIMVCYDGEWLVYDFPF